MKNHILPFSIPFVFLAACSHHSNTDATDAADMLFRKSQSLVSSYIDSMSHAGDSASFHNLVRNFDNKMTALNYEFPPDTDLALSEEQNDILIKLYSRFERVKQHRDSVINNKIPVDSVASSANDTVTLKADSVTKPLPSRSPGN